MEKTTIPQHVQMPNREDNTPITPKEQLVYVAIKRYMNKDTMEAFPSLVLISEKTGASIPTIREAIKTLIDLNYITVRKDGRKQVYKFNPYKQFEPFSYEFLDNPELTFLEKSYIIASQQYMFKSNGTGSLSYSTRELAEKINMSTATISRCNNSLQEKNFLTVVENNCKDALTGASTETKIFHLNEFGQAVVGMLKDHEDRITENTEDINQLKKQNELMMKEIASLKKQLNPQPTIQL